MPSLPRHCSGVQVPRSIGSPAVTSRSSSANESGTSAVPSSRNVIDRIASAPSRFASYVCVPCSIVPAVAGPHVIVGGLVRDLELETLGGRAGRDRRRERLARDRDRRVRHLDVLEPGLERSRRVVRTPPPPGGEALGVDRDHRRRERERARELEHGLAADHRDGVRRHRARGHQRVVGDRDLHVPVGADLLVRGVLVVAEHDRSVGGRDDQQADREHQQERGREARAGGAAEPAGREVRRQALGPRHRPVEPAQDPEQEPEREEREREDQQRRRQQHQRVELVPGARRLHRRPAELDEREQRDRQHEQLDRHARDQRAVLAREQATLLQDRPPDVRQREQQQRDRADERADRARARARTSTARSGKSTPGSDGPFAFEASVARAMPSNRPSGYATIAVNSGLHALRGEQLGRGEPAAAQHGELERLSRQHQRADAGEDRERDGADLEHDEEDRDAQVLHALLHERDQRVEPGAHLELGELGRRAELVGDPFDLLRDPLGPDERDADQVEVDVPHVLARQPRARAPPRGTRPIHQPRRELGRVRRRERRLVAEPEGVVAVRRVEAADERELGLFAGRADRGHGLADVDAEQARDPAGERDLAGSLRRFAAVGQVVGGAVAEQHRERERCVRIGPDQPNGAAPLRHDLADREPRDLVLQGRVRRSRSRTTGSRR